MALINRYPPIESIMGGALPPNQGDEEAYRKYWATYRARVAATYSEEFLLMCTLLPAAEKAGYVHPYKHYIEWRQQQYYKENPPRYNVGGELLTLEEMKSRGHKINTGGWRL